MSVNRPYPYQTGPRAYQDSGVSHINEAELNSALRFAEVIAHSHRGGAVATDDLLGEARLAIVECAARFEDDGGAQFSTYAWVRMRGSALDAIRDEDRHRRARVAAAESAGKPCSPSGRLVARASLKRLMDADDGLSSEDFRLIEGAYWQDCSKFELADSLGMSARTVHRRLALVVKRLKRQARRARDVAALSRAREDATRASMAVTPAPQAR